MTDQFVTIPKALADHVADLIAPPNVLSGDGRERMAGALRSAPYLQYGENTETGEKVVLLAAHNSLQRIAEAVASLPPIAKPRTSPPSDEITIEYEVTETATYRKSVTVTAEVAADPELLADSMSQDWNQYGDTQAHFIDVTERDYAQVTDED